MSTAARSNGPACAGEVHLPPVVRVDADACVNCHACISACPVKLCNDGSGEHVEINPDLCIGCGECIEACRHGARASAELDRDQAA